MAVDSVVDAVATGEEGSEVVVGVTAVVEVEVASAVDEVETEGVVDEVVLVDEEADAVVAEVE